jgi:hypothetical protein
MGDSLDTLRRGARAGRALCGVGRRGFVRQYQRTPRRFWVVALVGVLVAGLVFGDWVVTPAGVGLYGFAAYQLVRFARRRVRGRYRGYHSYTDRLNERNGFGHPDRYPDSDRDPGADCYAGAASVDGP